MAVYTISELLNQITDRVFENHERAISGPDMQEMLHDIVDSLKQYIDEAIVEPAENYYANEIQIDEANNTLTLVRAGGISPANISATIHSANYPRAGQQSLSAGQNTVTFGRAFPTGTSYLVFIRCTDADGFDIGGAVSDETVSNFKITVSDPCTLKYIAIKLL